MGVQVQHAIEVLFPHEGGRIRNVKFHRGWNHAVTAEQLAEQMMAATVQIRNGTAVRVRDVDGDLSV
jgi:hypothetical protein